MKKHMRLFEQLCRQVKERLVCGDAEVTVRFFCNRGKHRSVACAELFGSFMKAWPVNVKVNHWSLRKHPERRCKCVGCEDGGVKRPYASLVELFKNA